MQTWMFNSVKVSSCRKFFHWYYIFVIYGCYTKIVQKTCVHWNIKSVLSLFINYYFIFGGVDKQKSTTLKNYIFGYF